MISYLKGRVALKGDKYLILEVNGIGFEVFLSENNLKRLDNSVAVALFTYLDVGEKKFSLYGFLSREELELFKIIKSVPGIGSKASLEICSAASPEEIKKSIKEGNDQVFKGVPGIGPKKIRKIMAQLAVNIKDFSREIETKKKKKPIVDQEALAALLNLGFKKQEAEAALLEVPKEIKDLKEKIKIALKFLQR